eukprot:Nitzschia sp. Nitz4//scaffold44_size153857//149861//151132//NITZ4_002751-RA/size153857-processed-gene-0.120-mRNA-1//-1//CDS//3329552247//7954//frame0
MENDNTEENQVVPAQNQEQHPNDSATTGNTAEDSERKLPPEEYPTSVVTVDAESDTPPAANASLPASDEMSRAETTNTSTSHTDETVRAKHRETRAMRRAHEDQADDIKPGAYAVSASEDPEEPPIAPSSMSSINTKQRPTNYSSDRVSQDAIAKSRGRVTTGAAAASVSQPPPPSVAQRQGSVEPPPAAAARRSSAGSASSQTTSSLANAKVRGSHRGELRSREMRKSDMSAASSARSSTTQPPVDDDVKPGAQKIPGIGSQADNYDVENQVPMVSATRTSSLPPAATGATTVDYTGLPQVLDAVLVEIDEDGNDPNQYQSTQTQDAPVVQYQYQNRPANCCGCTGCTWATCCTITCVVFAVLIFLVAKELDTDAILKAINGETDAPTMSPTSSMPPTMAPTFMPSMMPSNVNSTDFNATGL